MSDSESTKPLVNPEFNESAPVEEAAVSAVAGELDAAGALASEAPEAAEAPASAEEAYEVAAAAFAAEDAPASEGGLSAEILADPDEVRRIALAALQEDEPVAEEQPAAEDAPVDAAESGTEAEGTGSPAAESAPEPAADDVVSAAESAASADYSAYEAGAAASAHAPAASESAPEPAASEPAAAAPAAAPEQLSAEASAVAAAVLEAPAPDRTLPFAPVKPTSRTSPSASGRISGTAQAAGTLAWGSRTDVGRVREHNEDSYVIDFPLFAVADGMGGHAAGEVASTIAVSTLAECQLAKADAASVGAAVERANRSVIEGVAQGKGRPGMGTTCTAVVIDGNKMAVGHVGDSRAYLLHEGKLLRVTHDHSFVEELVAAGEITPEEARVHPSRSIITRALGSDPNMQADSFTVDLTRGDRVLLCSDGLSSMITDDVIEEAMVTSPAPQTCADRLVDLALAAGGLDNVTVIVVDVKDDGVQRHALRTRVRNVTLWVLAVLLVIAAICGGIVLWSNNSWYLSDNGGYVTLNRGIPASLGGYSLHQAVERTNIEVSQLSEAVEERLGRGISFSSEDDARLVMEQWRQQIAANAAASASAQAATSASSSVDSTSTSAAASSQADTATTDDAAAAEEGGAA